MEENSASDIPPSEEKHEFSAVAASTSPPPGPRRDWKFWIVFPTLCLSGFAVTMEGSIVVTALPTISRALHTNQYAWIVNTYTFAATIFQPLTGWLADIAGRKSVMLGSIVLFAVGSAVAGAANNFVTIVVGRLIQGVGGGAVPLVAEIIISDMVELSERPKMLGMVMATSCLGLLLGPIFGGVIVDNTTWRWIFWLNLPLSGVSILCLLPIKQQRTANKGVKAAIKEFDWVGNFLLPASTVSLLLPLTMGGRLYDWSSFRVILPLVLGVCGLLAFGFYERFYCKHPLIPLHLLRNWSHFSLQSQSFIQSMLLMWINYFLTVYFQAVLAESPQKAGFNLMPTIVGMVVFSIVGGVAMSALKAPLSVLINIVAFSLMSIGLGVFTTLDAGSGTVVHAVLQIAVAAGNGLLLATILPAVQGHFPESDIGPVTALFNFIRSIALVWGVTIPSIIFDETVNKNISRVPTDVAGLLVNGGAYARASQDFITSFSGTTKEQIVGLYTQALRGTWWGAMSFGLLGLALVSLQRPKGAHPLAVTEGQEGKEDSS
ncbi:hypothetical protein AJ80_05561 [Polytolypa hystricis UAMH7299]|uniref:Major facilitator superfamily (MFS) profile domain-containing protein n=1 Tax=Polytolypa hystricis (strain UAMH7299) TaxID=1447883 RepID=A0A2B7Y3X7_POLH7|nr:hypothetical protein AJ80_05561 [Polytolypa hystricis UAMH7299]